jgi:serine/threonine-protein phosphatase PGAM5
MARTYVYLARHGEQDPATNHARDGGLSERGRAQADRLGRRLGAVTFDAIHHSPLARAAETARRVAAHLPGPPTHVCGHVTDRTPVPSPARRAEYPERWHRWLDAVPDDERDDDAVALTAAVAHFGVTSAEDRHELLVTHTFVIGWFVRHVLDAPVWRWIGLNHANCALTIVRFDADGPPTLLAYNDTGHL